MTSDVRALDPTGPDLAAWMACAATVFKDPAPVTPGRVEFFRERYLGQRLSAGYDRDRIVATYRSWDVPLSVPGGEVPADAISSVTVVPTHRRRGLLSAMMRADLLDAVERRVPVAILIASEAPIYGRFGFGATTETTSWTVDVRAATLRADAPRDGATELSTTGAIREHVEAVYAAARTPGAIDRSGW